MDENEENNVPIKLWKKAHLKKPKRLKKRRNGIQSESSAVPGMLSLGM